MAPRALKCEYCQGQYFLSSLPLHQRKCVIRLQHKRVPCPGCFVVLPVRDLKQHWTSCGYVQGRDGLKGTKGKEFASLVEGCDASDGDLEYPRVQFNEQQKQRWQDQQQSVLEPCCVCGRTFASNRLATHVRICSKVNIKSAKIKPSVADDAKHTESVSTDSSSQLTTKNWRKAHEEFVSGVQAARRVEALRRRQLRNNNNNILPAEEIREDTSRLSASQKKHLHKGLVLRFLPSICDIEGEERSRRPVTRQHRDRAPLTGVTSTLMNRSKSALASYNIHTQYFSDVRPTTGTKEVEQDVLFPTMKSLASTDYSLEDAIPLTKATTHIDNSTPVIKRHEHFHINSTFAPQEQNRQQKQQQQGSMVVHVPHRSTPRITKPPVWSTSVSITTVGDFPTMIAIDRNGGTTNIFNNSKISTSSKYCFPVRKAILQSTFRGCSNQAKRTGIYGFYKVTQSDNTKHQSCDQTELEFNSANMR